MMDVFLKKTKIIFDKFIEYHKMVNIDWKIRFIGLLVLFFYLLGVVIFGEKGPYVPPSQKSEQIWGKTCKWPRKD